MPIFPPFMLQPTTYHAACHEATQRVTASALGIASCLDRWRQKNPGGKSPGHTQRTRLRQWLLEQNFAQEGFQNAAQGNRIESCLFLAAQVSILDRLFTIHKIDIAARHPGSNPELAACAQEIQRHYQTGMRANARFKAQFSHTIQHEFGKEILKEKHKIPLPRAYQALYRTEEDIGFLRTRRAQPFTP